MTSGPTAQSAAYSWISQFPSVFAPGVELIPDPQRPFNVVGQQMGVGSKTVFRYRQCLDGTVDEACDSPNCFVDTHGARLVVLQVGSNCFQVVFAAAVLAPATQSCPPAVITGQVALTSVQNLPQYTHLPNWQIDELTILYSGLGTSPRRVWKIGAWDLAVQEAYTFFVDAETTALLAVRSDVHEAGVVSGSVRARCTHGVRPDIPIGIPNVLPNIPGPPLAIPFVRVQLDANNACPIAECPDVLCDSAWTVTTTSGSFQVYHPEPRGEVSVVANLQGACPLGSAGGPPWAHVSNCQTVNASAVCTACPLLPANGCFTDIEPHENPDVGEFIFNLNPSEFSTAQVNAHMHINRLHDLYTLYQPNFPGIEHSLAVQTNFGNGNIGCSAFFVSALGAPQQIVLFGSGPADPSLPTGRRCFNAAYSSIIAHEWGHFVIEETRPFLKGGSTAVSFNEGFADAFALLADNYPVVGPEFCVRAGVAGSLRDYDFAVCNSCPRVTYPCPPVVEFCGQENCLPGGGGVLYWCGKLLAGSWWDIRLNLPLSAGGHPTIARQLFTDWSQITVGEEPGSGEAAHPLTAIEVLVVDDTDGDFGNGTPNDCAICDAFLKHNIDCPPMWDTNLNRIPDHCESTALGARYVRTGVSTELSPVGLKAVGQSPNVACVDDWIQADGTLGSAVVRTPIEWGTVVIRDAKIVASESLAARTIYEMRKYHTGEEYTVGLVEMPVWGDVYDSLDSPGIVDVDDLSCMLDGFGGCVRCPIAALDLMPCGPSVHCETTANCQSAGLGECVYGHCAQIDIDDLLAVIDAMQALPDPCGSPCISPMSDGNVKAMSESTAQFSYSGTSSAGPREGVTTVDVFLEGLVQSVRCFQVQLVARDEEGAPVAPESIFVDSTRTDHLFLGQKVHWAKDQSNSRVVACLPSGGGDGDALRHLATFVFPDTGTTRIDTIEFDLNGTHLRDPLGGILDFEVIVEGEQQLAE